MERTLVSWLALSAGVVLLACSPTGAPPPAPVSQGAAPSREGAASGATPADAAPASTAPAGTAVSISAAPAPSPCDDVRDGSERLKCKFDALADAGVRTGEALQRPPYHDLLSDAQRTAVQHAKDRIGRQKARLGSDRLRSLWRKRASTCQLAECDGTLYPACVTGNGDGICDPGEDCLEVIGDGIGDDRQPCAPTKGKGREACVEVCEDEAVCREGTNLDSGIGTELEGVYDDMQRHVDAVNAALPALAPAVRALVAPPGDAPCVLDAQGLERTNDALAALAKGAAVGARGGADIAERACDQTVWGFNCAECCAPAEAIAGLLAMTNDLVETMDAAVNSATLDAALACVASVNAAANASLAELQVLQEGLGRVEASQAEIVRLLQTPPGRRPEYPRPVASKP